jgi:hypothetical protein
MQAGWRKVSKGDLYANPNHDKESFSFGVMAEAQCTAVAMADQSRHRSAPLWHGCCFKLSLMCEGWCKAYGSAQGGRSLPSRQHSYRAAFAYLMGSRSEYSIKVADPTFRRSWAWAPQNGLRWG